MVNGTTRVVVSQMHRSPGVFFDHDSGKTHTSGKYLFSARVIPYRGSWIDFEFDHKDMLYARIDRKRKIPITTFLLCLPNTASQGLVDKAVKTSKEIPHDDIVGMTREEILHYFYRRITLVRTKHGWQAPFDAKRLTGIKLVHDLIDARTRKVHLKAGERVNAAIAKRLVDAGVKDLLIPFDDLSGRYIADDMINEKTGEIYFESGDEINEQNIELLKSNNIDKIVIFDIDHIHTGSYLVDTFNNIEKNDSRLTALLDIYKILRPGEPPSQEASQTLFYNLFFNPDRYDLSDVGRVKLNSRLGVECEDTIRVLRTVDILEIIRVLLGLRDGEGAVDDIDHLSNRRVRSVGELLENQYRVGLVRMERAIRERMSSVQIETVMPSDLVNAKPAANALKEFFTSSQLSQFMDQANPLAELTHKRRLSALGPGVLSRERAGFDVRDVHHSHYGRICPIETPEGPNIGLLVSLATYARTNEFGFIETPYRKILTQVENGDPEELIGHTPTEDVKADDGKTIVKKGTQISVRTSGRISAQKNKIINVKPYVSNDLDDIIHLSADDEEDYYIAQANSAINEAGEFINDRIETRRGEEVGMEQTDSVRFMDVSPLQLVSVSTSLIPFLEHDDANRALMGSNMQRQAVPLLKPEKPLVGTGMEMRVARDSGQVMVSKTNGIVTSVTGNQIIVTDDDGKEVTHSLVKFHRSNQGTCLNQRPIIDKGTPVNKGDVLADGSSTDSGELALGQNVLVAFMTWEGYNFEDAIILSNRLIKEDKFTSVHIEKHEVEARDTKLGPEEITRDIPNIGEDSLRNLDEEGIIRVGAEVSNRDIFCLLYTSDAADE